jgi:hypothetical protein
VASRRDTDFYIAQIEALLTLASDPRTPDGERESAQTKADSLMFKARIDSAMLFQEEGPAAGREVIVKEYGPTSGEEFVGITNHLRASVFMHVGCMVHDRFTKLTVVGYEDEIRVAEMLWAQIFLHLTRTIFPRWEKFRSFDANIFELKQAGYSWPFVCEQGLRQDAGDHIGKLTQKNSASKLRSAYKREAKRRGIEVGPGKQQPINPKKWRRSFAEAYASKVKRRLADLQAHNEAEAGETGVLALMSEQDRVKQQFYAMFPEMNPEVQKRRQEEYKAR